MTDKTTVTDPTPEQARALLRSSAAATAAVRDLGGNRHAQWLACHAVSSFFYFTARGIADSTSDIYLVSSVFGLMTLVLFVTLLLGLRMSKAGMGRRWAWALATWGVLYMAGMLIGGSMFPADPWFWLPAGVVVALPLALGAWRENHA